MSLASARPQRTHSLSFAALAAVLYACSGAPSGPDAGTFDATDPKALLAAVDQLSGPLKDKPKSFEVGAALGNLYYENGRYLDAIDAYRLALEKAAPIEAETLALEAKGVKAAEDLPVDCRRPGTSYGLEEIAAAARKLVVTDATRALRCYREAIGGSITARSRRGNALYLVGQPDGALAEHRRVLTLEKDYPESLFFIGAIILEQSKGEKAQLEEGKRWWRRLLKVAPQHPRAALVRENLPKADELFTPKPQAEAAQGAGGGNLPPGHPSIDGQASVGPVRPDAVGQPLPPGHPALDRVGAGAGPAALPGAGGPSGPMAGNMPGAPMAHSGNQAVAAGGASPEAVAAMAEAVGQTERTPELEKGLDELIVSAEADLDAGKYAEARGKIVRVMPMRPDDPKTAATMGAAMRGLGRAEMAERVLGRALQGDPKSPRANYEMGLLLAGRGDKEGAKQRFAVVQSSDAKWAAAHNVGAELAKLK